MAVAMEQKFDLLLFNLIELEGGFAH